VNGTTLQIRGYHCDAYGHVNNARYLELLEEARWSFLEPALKEKFNNISYKKPLVPTQVIDIEITDVTYNNKSMVVRQTIVDKSTQELASEALVTFVLLNSKTGKPETITAEIIAKLDELTDTRND
jgi:thioesterase-3